ncbi:MAG TPA: hypothetical protein DDW86_05465 [Clostridiales bacterium]|nr:hypothetical protein [Clostridiales bacterium]
MHDPYFRGKPPFSLLLFLPCPLPVPMISIKFDNCFKNPSGAKISPYKKLPSKASQLANHSQFSVDKYKLSTAHSEIFFLFLFIPMFIHIIHSLISAFSTYVAVFLLIYKIMEST